MMDPVYNDHFGTSPFDLYIQVAVIINTENFHKVVTSNFVVLSFIDSQCIPYMCTGLIDNVINASI